MNIQPLQLVRQVMAVVLTMFWMAACSVTTASAPDTSIQASRPESKELNLKNAEAYYKRGFSYYVQGETTKAINDYSKAIELNPNYADAYENRGQLYYIVGEKTKAIADYSRRSS